MKKILLAIAITALPFAFSAQNNTSEGLDENVIATAKEAYIYGLPIVLTDLTRIAGGKASNQFNHTKGFPDHSFKTVVRPNNDTYYSSAFLDLGDEPVILVIPDTKDRYAVFPLMDAWTNIFASFGKRTTGTKAQKYIITGPHWKGTLPGDIKEVKSPTDLVWLIGRTQVNSPEDGKNFVTKIQDGLNLIPLSVWQKNEKKTPSILKYGVETTQAVKGLKAKSNVVEALKKLNIEEYFNYLNELLVKNPALKADKEAIAKFAKIGITPGGKFNLLRYNAGTQSALQGLVTRLLTDLGTARNLFKDQSDTKPDLTIGHYGTDYLKRAATAYFGLGALGQEEAVYIGYRLDANQQTLNGNNKYVIHFEPKKTPPAQAFWSYTVYDQEGYLVENPIRRYAIGDRDNLKYNADGSLDIYLQNERPEEAKVTNWLPIPKADFNITARIYWATDEYLKTGNWKKPPIKKVI